MIVKSIKAFLQNNKWWQFEQFICLYLKPGIKWGASALEQLFSSSQICLTGLYWDLLSG